MNVRLLDLRDSDPAHAKETARARFGTGTPLGSGRLLVLDRTDLLAGHTRAYEELLTGGRVRWLVCVVCGPPVTADDDGRRILLRPGPLGTDRDVATLWVGDGDGMEWGPRPSDLPRTRPGTTPGDHRGLKDLTDLLVREEVFDRVIEISRELPDAVAAPGLSLTDPGSSTDAVTSALTRALRRFTAPAPAPDMPLSAGRSTGILIDLLEGTHRSAFGTDDPGNGELARHEARARDEIAGVRDLMTMAASPLGAAHTSPATILEEGLPQAGRALADYRTRVEQLATRVHSLPDERVHGELDRWGVGGLPPSDEDVTEALDLVADRVETRLRQGTPPHGVITWLDRAAERIAPRTTPPTLSRIRERIPDRLIAALESPAPPTPPGIVSPLLAAAFLLPLAAALIGGVWGLASGIALAVGWVCALTLGLHRAAPTRDTFAVTGAHALLGFTGLAAGLLLSTVITLPTWLPPPLAALMVLIVGTITGGLVLLTAWSALITRWRRESALDEAETAVGDLTRLVDLLAREEWRTVTGRRRLADGIRAASAALRAISDSLAETARDLPPPTTHPAELEAVLSRDLADLTTTALSGLWNVLRSGIPAQDAYGHARSSITELIDAYLDHVQQVGPHTPPDFSRRDGTRRTYRAFDLERALHTLRTPAHERMLQLCDPDQTPLLSTALTTVREIRFAPLGLRDHFDTPTAQDPAPKNTVWTHGGRWVGVLRLFPLRTGTVRTRWDDTAGADTAPDTPASPPTGPYGMRMADTEDTVATPPEDGTAAAPAHPRPAPDGTPPEEDYFR
ncbi:hypothetical protein [Nocardiopsis sp. CC223A]|uniref:hypothetical protein n=1 Tax=Nocardiopsis sp. CC223A TaxID=3044051 RepID=UPI00278BFD69|nr:hypothetical protein [Nocardiopsis sp. CC223A]